MYVQGQVCQGNLTILSGRAVVSTEHQGVVSTGARGSGVFLSAAAGTASCWSLLCPGLAGNASWARAGAPASASTWVCQQSSRGKIHSQECLGQCESTVAFPVKPFECGALGKSYPISRQKFPSQLQPLDPALTLPVQPKPCPALVSPSDRQPSLSVDFPASSTCLTLTRFLLFLSKEHEGP